jgi:hypothetical protein
MSLRREREKQERRERHVYEAVLAVGAAVLVAGLLFAFGLVLYATVLSPRAADRPSPTGFSTLPASPDPPRP